mgnify:CR=1 FL=1
MPATYHENPCRIHGLVINEIEITNPEEDIWIVAGERHVGKVGFFDAVVDAIKVSELLKEKCIRCKTYLISPQAPRTMKCVNCNAEDIYG